MWEGGIRVPGIIVWPGHITKPMQTQMFANTLDQMPTLLDLLGITVENHEFDGMSLLPLLQGKDMTERTKAMPFVRDNDSAKASRQVGTSYTKEELTDWWHTFECPQFKEAPPISGWAAWIEGRWKLHRPRKSDEYELYDIVADPAETTDLATSKPDVVKDLSAKLLKWQLSANKSLAGADSKTAPTVKIK
jgi:arylsulfatase A-like enzyme